MIDLAMQKIGLNLRMTLTWMTVLISNGYNFLTQFQETRDINYQAKYYFSWPTSIRQSSSLQQSFGKCSTILL